MLLPPQLTSFIGREKEMAEIKRLLVSSRLVTLTGAGGCGKTRLALRIATDLRDVYANGVCWVDLAPLADPSLIPQAIATVMNIREPTGRTLLDLVLDVLHDKRLLLILDNCEHLALACAEIVHDVLCDAPQIRILATSREPLAVMGEMLFPVAPLALPPKTQGTDIARYDSIQLFVERARGILPGFTLTSANSLPVAEICRRLDGIPLAIELASARVNVLTVEQIAARLDDRFALLTSARHGVPSHHRTLRAAIDWSVSTLSAPEQRLLQRLSVFAGDFTLEAVEQVCAGEGIAAEQIVDGLSSLVIKSLVVAETLEWGEARYRMLETIRQYARDRLLESEEGESIRNQHLDYFLKLAEEVEPKLHGPDQNEWLDRLDRDHDNLRAALEWSLGAGRVGKGLRLAAALTWFWELRTYWTEARQRAKTLLSQPEAAPRTLSRAKALLVIVTMGGWGGVNFTERSSAEELIAIAREHGAAGRRVLAAGLAAYSHMFFSKDPPGAISIADEGLALARSLGDEWLMAFLLLLRGWYSTAARDYPAAMQAMEESQARFKTIGDPYFAITALALVNYIYLCEGDLDRARQGFEQFLPVFRKMRDRRGVVNLLGWLGDIEHGRCRYDLAKRYYMEYLEVAREIGEKSKIAHGSLGLGLVSLYERDLNSARLLFADCFKLSCEEEVFPIRWAIFGCACLAAAEMNPRHAIRLFAFIHPQFRDIDLAPDDKMNYAHYRAVAREQVDEEAFNAAWAEGSVLTMEQAIAIAEQELLASPSTPAPALPRDSNGLTPRETEVLRLVAAGLSDAQVAARLVISRRTVSTHLTAIYGKLGVSSRSAATRYALDHNLV